jgi:hypothetical protein
MQNHPSLVVLASFALALAGCSKHSSEAAANPKDLNLGVIEVSDGIQSRHDLGDGKVCIITPTIQNGDGVVLDVQFEESGKLLASPRPRVQTVSGRPATFFDGNISFELTPHIKGSATHFEERQAVVITQSADDKDTVLPGRHMSEKQVADIVFRELPSSSGFRCEFKDGVWEILEVQKDVWGVASVTTNTDGKISVRSTNATRLVLRVRDGDGKVEQVETP